MGSVKRVQDLSNYSTFKTMRGEVVIKMQISQELDRMLLNSACLPPFVNLINLEYDINIDLVHKVINHKSIKTFSPFPPLRQGSHGFSQI